MKHISQKKNAIFKLRTRLVSIVLSECFQCIVKQESSPMILLTRFRGSCIVVNTLKLKFNVGLLAKVVHPLKMMPST